MTEIVRPYVAAGYWANGYVVEIGYVAAGYWKYGYVAAAAGKGESAPIVPAMAPVAGGAGPSSRNSDPHAYDPERIAARLAKVIINGVAYDPFHDGLAAILDAAAREPATPEAKLERTFTVRTSSGPRAIPLSLAMLDTLPDLATADEAAMEAYAISALAEINEQRRRIVLLLLDS